MKEAFKTLATQSQNLMFAAQRQFDLIEQKGAVDDNLQFMVNQLFEQVYSTLDGINKSLNVRIAPEQIDADQTLRNALEQSLANWKAEREVVQHDQMEQAIKDAKDGNKSERYVQLEQREQELNKNIAEAEQKLGKVTERIHSPAFNGLINKVIHDAKK